MSLDPAACHFGYLLVVKKSDGLTPIKVKKLTNASLVKRLISSRVNKTDRDRAIDSLYAGMRVANEIKNGTYESDIQIYELLGSPKSSMLYVANSSPICCVYVDQNFYVDLMSNISYITAIIDVKYNLDLVQETHSGLKIFIDQTTVPKKFVNKFTKIINDLCDSYGEDTYAYCNQKVIDAMKPAW